MTRLFRALLLLVPVAATIASLSGQARITTPKDQFGFNLGDDYQLADYKQIAEYWRKLDAESERHGRPGDRQDG